jgi:hypothetical protein
MPSLTVIAALELRRAGKELLTAIGHDAQPVLSCSGAGFGFQLVGSDGGFDGAFGGALEETQDLVTLFAMLGFFGGLNVLAAHFGCGCRVMLDGFVQLFFGGVERPVGAGSAKMLFGEFCRLVRGSDIRPRWRW